MPPPPRKAEEFHSFLPGSYLACPSNKSTATIPYCCVYFHPRHPVNPSPVSPSRLCEDTGGNLSLVSRESQSFPRGPSRHRVVFASALPWSFVDVFEY